MGDLFDNMCRCCLENDGTTSITNNQHLSHILFVITSIKVMANVGSPHIICAVCTQRLHDAYSFRDQCLRNDAKLQNYKGDIKPEIQLDDEDAEWLNFDDNDIYGDGVFLKFNKKTNSQDNKVIKKTDKDQGNSIHRKRKNVSKKKNVDLETINKKIDKLIHIKNELEVKRSHVNEINIVAEEIENVIVTDPLQNSDIGIKNDTTRKKTAQIENPMFICDLCGHSVRKKWDLITHMRKHTGEKPYHCDICNKNFAYLAGFRNHQHTHNKFKSFVCEECGARLSTKETLQAHMRLHSGEMPFSCSVCGRKFRALTNLRSHSKIHTQDKRHPCPICSKMFYTKSDMRDHARRHSGDRPFSCPLCPRRFTGRSNQRLHMKIHAGQKDFQCPNCTKTFVGRDAMVRHSKIHNTERAFICGECGRKFTHKSSLKTHQVTHTNAKEYICDICNQRFGYASGLHAHRKRKHNIQSTRSVMPIKNNDEFNNITKIATYE